MSEQKMVTVRVPQGRYPNPVLRKPGPKRVRLVDTDDEIRAGLKGGVKSKAVRSKADYYTTEPETVELTPWVERMIRRGSLEEVVTSSPPKGSRPAPAGDKPTPL